MEHMILNNNLSCPVVGIGTFMLSPAEAQSAEQPSAEPGAEQIVKHAQSVIETFYDLLEKELSQKNIVGLITGYERVLRFCKYMNICGDVAVNCVKRIAQLQDVTDNEAAPSDEMIG